MTYVQKKRSLRWLGGKRAVQERIICRLCHLLLPTHELYSPNPVNTASYKMKLIVEECVDSRKCYRSRAEIRRGKVEDMIALKWGETDDLLPMNPEGAEVDVS